MAAIVMVTPPPVQPVTLDEAKMHLRIEAGETQDDALITGLIAAASMTIEHWLSRALVEQTLELRLDMFPDDVVILPRGPVAGVESVAYDDISQVEQIIAAESYRVDTSIDQYGRVYPVDPWPAAYDATGSARFRYVAGWLAPEGAATTPQPIKVAINLLVAHWYINTEAAGGDMSVMPLGVQELVAPYRVIWV
jgi:uncharacterized phiE125 gp8 family phage protein